MTGRPDVHQMSALLSALRDFELAPGRYPLALREPRVLFDQSHTLLLLATGRMVKETHACPGSVHPADIQRAARYFIRMAFLQVGCDHYTLLGLSPNARAEQIRDHFRLMIRLTHPDFGVEDELWPKDAASRINIANDVLSSPVKRAEYDALRKSASPQSPQSPNLRPPATRNKAFFRPRNHRPAYRTDSRWIRLLSPRSTAVVGIFTAVAGAAAMWLLNPSEQGALTAQHRSISEETESYLEAGKLPSGLVGEMFSMPAMALPTSRKVIAPSPQAGAPSIPVRKDAASPKAAMAATSSAVVESEVTPIQGTAPTSQTLREVAPSAPTPVAQPAPEPVISHSSGLSMAQVHPALTNVVGSLYSGRGESLTQWIDRDWQTLPANQAFVTQYNQWLSGHRVTQLGKVSFRSRNVGEQLIVDGLVEMHIQDSQNTVQVRDLQLRAYFQPVNGRPILTQLTASQAN